MRSDRLHELSAGEIIRGTSAGDFSVEQVATACLERIVERDTQIHAWEALDPEALLNEARALDRKPDRGPLFGVPVGIKDVIDTADLPTQMGSPLYRGYQPRFDAACVAQIRQAGALMMGKTVTAEFAGTAPTRTRNPHNLAHTPGGSSSGSGAAVADYMVPVAFGTQTGGSVLRPAAFCGVVGFKPTFGSYNPVGTKPAAESLDTIGLIAREIDDIELFHSVLTGATAALASRPRSPPRIGLCRTHVWETALSETKLAIDDAERAIVGAGGQVQEVQLPGDARQLTEERAIINAYERARGLSHEWFHGKEQLSDRLVQVCERGFAISAERYTQAQRVATASRQEVAGLFSKYDALLTASTPGEAPSGYEYAGDPRFQEIWTLLHLPTISLPTHIGPTGLPVGIQLVGAHYEEQRLFALARWLTDKVKHNSK